MPLDFKEGSVICFLEKTENIQKGKEYVVIDIQEEFPRYTIGNRLSSYDNTIQIQALMEDGKYEAHVPVITFTTAKVNEGAISKDAILVVRQMKKTYV